MSDAAAQALVATSAGPRLALIATSFVRLTGRPLIAADADPGAALWAAPRVVLAHGTQADFINPCT